MKDEQKVWIRGVEGRGNEVIKMLEDRGGISVWEHGGYPGNIYFITHSGSVDYCPEDDETAKIIMDNYTELHLPEKWKDGDVLVSDDGLFFVLRGDFELGVKEVVDWKWEPKEDDDYYYIDNDGNIVHDFWDECNLDTDRYNFGNCFPTKEEAEAMAEKIKKLLKGE